MCLVFLCNGKSVLATVNTGGIHPACSEFIGITCVFGFNVEELLVAHRSPNLQVQGHWFWVALPLNEFLSSCDLTAVSALIFYPSYPLYPNFPFLKLYSSAQCLMLQVGRTLVLPLCSTQTNWKMKQVQMWNLHNINIGFRRLETHLLHSEYLKKMWIPIFNTIFRDFFLHMIFVLFTLLHCQQFRFNLIYSEQIFYNFNAFSLILLSCGFECWAFHYEQQHRGVFIITDVIIVNSVFSVFTILSHLLVNFISCGKLYCGNIHTLSKKKPNFLLKTFIAKLTT
jgi:hypothetical protein